MPYRNESKLMTQDAPADVSTELCFNPPNGPFDGKSMESMVTGTLTSKYDVDWIALEMSEGKEYTFELAGSEMLTDTKIRILDSKGNEIMALDDVDMDGDGRADSLHPTIKFTPEAGSGTQKYHIEVSAYTGNPGTNNIMIPADWTLTANQMDVPDPTDGETIDGTLRMDDTTTTDVDETNLVDDKLRGTAQNDTINGLAGDDSMYGMAGDDELNGGDGDDLLSGGPGADELNGGDGDDTITYSYSAMGVTINLGDGTARGGNAEGDTLGDDIENVIGSMHDDMLTGTRNANSIWGLGGNDELDGGRRDDKLFGGAGDDDLDGGAGDDDLTGGYGADTLTGGDGDDTALYSGSMYGVTVRLHSQQAMGGDAEGDVFGDTATVPYTNEDEEEVMMTVPDIVDLTGSDMGDILAGDLRDNVIMGGGGDDKIYGGPNPADAHMMNHGLTNVDMLHGGTGDDMIFGGAGNDTLNGDEGDDMLHGGPGNDTYYGGAGSDMIYADADDVTIDGWLAGQVDDTDTDDVNESVEAEADPMTADTVSYARLEDAVVRTLNDPGGSTAAGDTTITNVENIIGSQGDDTLTGSDQNNVIEGGEGGDTLNGGDGSDTLSYASSDDWVRVTLGATAADEATTSRGHASGDTATNFENVTGSAHDDDITGNAEANVLKGLAGDDELVAGGEADTVEGGAGADDMDGGVDRSDTNEAGDTLSYAGSDAGVTVNLATASFSGGHAEGDTIATIETDHDMDSDDTNGDDKDGDGDNDDDDDTIAIEVSTFENLTGSMHDDTLTGDYRFNVINGMGGNDTIRGGGGIDHLIGGAGADLLDGGTSGDDPDTADIVENDIDWAVYRMATVDDEGAGVTVNLASRRGEAGDAMGDTLVNIELVWGSMGDDVFKASDGPDYVHGDTGNDTMSYELSDMGVIVSLADDNSTTFDGTNAPAETDLGAAIDYADENGDPVVIADADEDQIEDNTNGAALDRLGGIENLTGSDHADTLTGDGSDNVLMGGGGKDVLAGGAGDDKIHGGAGDDTISAASGANELHGNAGDDTITGGTDADTINGGAGDDDLSGGTGDDTFIFSPDDGAGSDIILDYLDGDMIDLSAYGLSEEEAIAAITLRGAPGAGQVVINLEAHGGGRITIEDINDLDTFDEDSATGVEANDMIDVLDQGIIII